MALFGGVYAGKRVLVTGHTGFKGSWLSQWLLELGADVAGFSNGVPSEPSHFEVLKLSSKLKHFVGDVRDLPALQRAFSEFNPQVVFHLAAQAIVRASYDDPKTTFDTNLGGTVNLLECVRKTPAVEAVVVVTSDKCYENVEWEFGYRETDALGGQDPYSASKACAEIAFSAYARSYFSPVKGAKTKLASARAGNVIGGGDWAKDRIIPDFVRAWSQGKPVTLRNPASTRPWQHVLEPLGGYLWLGASLLRSNADVVSESFNFGPPANVNQSVDELIAEIHKTWSAGSWQRDPAGNSGMKEAGLLKLNCDKALHRLGWEPTLQFAETAGLTADWYKSYYLNPAKASELTTAQIRKYQELARERGRIWTQ